jgi:DNA-binding beta-propeller fold protein YncE
VGAVRGARRIVTVAAVAMAVGLLPAVAHAQVFGSLAQLQSPNNCIESTSTDSTECQTKGDGLSFGTDDAVMSPDGKNVYVISTDDDSIAEFTRNADGSLTELGCIADSSDGDSTCPGSDQTATGLVDPEAIAISPDGNNVYVAASDSEESGDVAEFTRNPDGTLTPVADNDCIAQQGDDECAVTNALGLDFPVALAVSPNGENVYVADHNDDAVAILTRDPGDGALTEPNPASDCLQDPFEDSSECPSSVGNAPADGLSEVTGVAVSPDGANVYTTGAPNSDEDGSIAEFSVGQGGQLTPIGCLGTPEGEENCNDEPAPGVLGATGLVVSPDGENVYTASQLEDGPIAEFSRGAGGVLQQLSSTNDCIQEQGADYTQFGFTCGTTNGLGIGSGYQLAVSPDGANVYAAAPEDACYTSGTCGDVAEFARNTAEQGALTQLSSPNSCIQESGQGTDCSGNENGTGLGGAGVVVSPDNANVYVTGVNGIAEFARLIPTLTVSLAGPGSGGVSDGTGGISCQPTCSHAYGIGQVVTLTATPAFGSAFSGWSGGGCSGTAPCQVVMDADTAVTATFAVASGAPGVSPGPPTVTGPNGAGLSGSVDPEGLTTTAYFEYGIDLSDRGPGSSTTLYDQTTPVQPVGADFSEHAISSTLAGLVPNVTYHFRLVANNGAGTATGPDQTFTTAKNAPPPTPVLGKTVNVSVVSGQVFILPPPGQSLGGAGDRAALSKGASFEPLTEARQIPTGSEIDALHGSLKMVSNTGQVGKTQTATLTGSVFKVTQVRKGITKGMTDFNLIESAFQGAPSYGLCKAKGKKATDATVASLSTKTLQLLKVSGHGKFRTTGRYSAATVRGTIYTVADKCNGTLTHVIRDTVLVDDFARHKTILLHAGQSYLAKKP